MSRLFDTPTDRETLESHLVSDLAIGERISVYLRGRLANLPSTNSVMKALKRGDILVDGVAVTTAHWVVPGQLITLLSAQGALPKPYALKLEIIFEDDQLAVVIKPAGVEVFGKKFKTFQNAILHNLKPQNKGVDDLDYPRPVHRLDYGTSGPMLVAKTHTAIRSLSRQFEEHRVHKHYRAVVMGQGVEAIVVDEPLSGLAARTRFMRVEMIPSLQSGFLSLMDAFPESGRTHQIRRHLQFLGTPILGDTKYGPPEGKNLKGKSIFLAAIAVGFVHPLTGASMHFKVPMPPKFRALMERETRRWAKFRT